MSHDVVVTLTYSEREAREVIRAIRYFDSNVTAHYEDHDRMGLIATAIQLRLPPPKPKEPTGLGAVVEDAEGLAWIRVEPHDPRNGAEVHSWWNRVVHAMPIQAPWSKVNAVTILSEGVQQP